MSRIVHYIDFLDGNGLQEVTPPVEWKDLEIEWNFDQNEQRLNTTAFTWADQTAVDLNDCIARGLTGDTGIFEGVPYKVVLECDTITITILEACINFAAEDAEYFCDIVKIPAKESGNIDFVTDRAESFRFQFLAEGISSSTPGFISTANYIDVWYVVGKYPQTADILLASIGIFILIKEAYETIKRIADAIAAIVGGVTGIAESILQIAALIAYLVLMIIAIIQLLDDFINLIFPFVYYHRAMLERTLWSKACAYLGLGYTSTIHSSTSVHYNDYLMPPKNTVGERVGNPSTETGYYDGTFGDFIRGQIEKYNGEIKVINGVVNFERRKSFAILSNFKIPENKYESYKYNAAEIPSNYVIQYLYDGIDLHDFDATNGRSVQVITEPLTVVNKKNVLLKNLTERNIPYSLAKVKTSQSEFEVQMATLFNTYALVANAIASLFAPNAPTIPSIPIGNNLNVLQLDTHFTSVHKTASYQGSGKTNPDLNNTVGAKKLFEDLHYSEIAKPLFTGNGNQWKRFGLNGDYKIALCCEDAVQIAQNNYGKYQGNDARFISVKWRPNDEIATIAFESQENYTSNLKVTLLEPYQAAIVL